MLLKELLKKIPCVEMKGGRGVEIHSLSDDSRLAVPGALFIARSGAHEEGAKWIAQAVDAGAAAVVTDLYDPFVKIPQIITPFPEKLIPLLAARFYGHPSKALTIIGVTGTKGKTSTCYLIAHLLKGLKKEPGLMTTIETIIGPHRMASTLTTHGVIHNHKKLADMKASGCQAAVLEVSSHGLAQGRIDEVEFAIGVFTNLSPDHLDYHGTMEAYAAAKRKLFEKSSRCVLNGDSPWSVSMRTSSETLLYGLESHNDVSATDIEMVEGKVFCQLTFRGEKVPFKLSWIGRHNIYNVLGAVSVGLFLGASLKEIGAILEKAPEVPGRLQKVPNAKGLSIFVDYAHTGESLSHALKALREAQPKRLFVVFGCGGNRDPQRRSAMARAAEKAQVDGVILTSDNPRNEDPEEIIRQILAGFSDVSRVQVEMDRKKAIERAIAQMTREDTLLIAGKGHEKCQIFAHHTIPFDDVQVAKEALR